MDYRQLVRSTAERYGLDPNLAEAVMAQESGGRPDAVSPAGAAGLMQLMPGTAKELGVNPNDPVQNIDGGVRYLKQQVDKFGVAGGLAAYNAGPGRVVKVGGQFAALPTETQEYVPRVMNRTAEIAQQRGGAPVEQPPQPQVPDIPTLLGGLEKAKAANDTDAVNEIGGLVKSKFESALAAAKSANDTEAVKEIEGAMGKYGFGAASPAPVAGSSPKPTPSGGITVLPTSKESLKRDLSLGTRNVLEGVEQAVTYPVRAVADAASGALKLAGKAEIADYVARNWGTRGNAGRVLSDMAGLAKPQNKAEEIVAAGTKAAAGLIPGTALSSVVREAPALAQGVSGILMPGTSGTAGQVAKDVAVYGGLGAAMDAAPAETAAALALATAGKAGYDKFALNRGVDKFIKNAGRADDASVNAEIIKRAEAEFNNPARMVEGKIPPLSAKELNQKVRDSFLREGKEAVSGITDRNTKKVLTAALNRGVNNTQDEIAALSKIPGGDMVADIIDKATRADKMTSAIPAKGGIIGNLIREGLDRAPATIASTLSFGVPVPVKLSTTLGLGQRLMGRQTREQVGSELVNPKTIRIADEVLSRLGPSQASQGLSELQSLSSKAQAAVQARAQAVAQARAAQAAQDEATRIGVLQQTRRPLSGGFQELLPGGRANTNMTSGQAIDALRILKRQGGPVGEAADQILKSKPVTNQDAFYGLQNAIRGLQERGVAPSAPGVLSGGPSPVRNPISYAEAVRTAGEAANLARSSAPSKELALFATTIAKTKAPSDKAKLLADRRAKATDPNEIAYLNNFIEPLTRFGAK